MCKSKIHRATVTDANLEYEGSITLDPLLMEAADLREYERVQVLNLQNGARFETYIIRGTPGEGEVILNGPAARLVQSGDQVIIISYAEYSEAELEDFEPRLVFVDEANRVRRPGPESMKRTSAPRLGVGRA